MAILRLFAGAREAAGTSRDEFEAATVGDVLVLAVERYGPDFEAVLGTSRVWVNGDAADDDTVVASTDEVAVLPPVSGGA